jgi:tetratricopeptide (TPR) repeat protein
VKYALALVLIATSAHAQSTRYPPQPIDKDQERTDHSTLWEAATNPSQEPYQALIAQAKQGIESRSADQLVASVQLLDQAVALLPHSPDAYRWRGEAQFYLSEWAKCADDLHAAATDGSPHDSLDKRAAGELQLRLGNCQARAGRLGEAERTFAEAAASGTGNGELLMRLGEVRIAMGKLDEAIAALGSALEATDGNAQGMIHFLLAEAYDRARRPGDALAEAAEGVKLDRQLAVLHNPVIPLLGAGEASYMLGLAHSADPARPEYALAYFRRFVKEAPDSPWRRRAEDHLRELRGVDLPDSVTRGGSAPLDLDAVRGAARRAMPQLRACLARFPTVVVEVEISRSGPRTPPTDRVRPRFFTPPDGVTVRVAVGVSDLAGADLDAVDRCLETQANRLALPAVHEHDVYYKAMFDVVGP